MKKILFLLSTIFAVQTAMAEFVEIASYTFPDQQLSTIGSQITGSGSNILGTNCTVSYSGVGGENSTGTAIHAILNENYYHKLNGNSSYITIKRLSEDFMEGDKFTATMYAGSSSKTDGFYFKAIGAPNNYKTISTESNKEVKLEYVLTSDDINDDGSVTVYRYSSNCYVREITISRDNGVEKEEATTSFNSEYFGFSLTAKTSEGQAVTTNSTGAVSYSSSNESVVTINETTGALTAVGIGKAQITANVAADDTYYASSATYTIYVLSDGKGTIANPYLPTDFRYHAEKGDLASNTKAWVVGYIVGVYNSTEKDIKIITTTTTTSSSIGLGNTAEESVGKNCLSVQLISDTDPRNYLNLKDNPSMLGQKVWMYGRVGTFTSSEQTVYGLAHADEFRYGADALEVTIGSTGYATFSAMRGYALPSEMDAYVATSQTEGKITLTKIEDKIVPAFTGVVLKGTTATLTANEANVDVTTNLLQPNLTAATLAATTGDYTNYILVPYGAGGVMFAPSSGSGTLAANRAYLQLPTPSADAREYILSFDDDELTGIKAVESSKEKSADVYYDLSGRRVAQPTKGLYIMNGKKYIVK